MQASGNDFIVIDHREPFIKNINEFTRKVCVRQFSIGADGVLLIEKSGEADFKMRIINADGSEAEMCGNGSRCVVLYAAEILKFKLPMRIETLAGIISGDIKQGWIKVKLTDPKEYRPSVQLDVNGKKISVSYINTGVPHVIHFPENLKNYDVREAGKIIRFHREFSPAGTNVNFVQVTGPSDILVRTYERGVEDETFACGTGVTASSIVSALEYQVKSPVNVRTSGGEMIKVYFDLEGGKITNVFLEGKAFYSFKGELVID